MLHNMSKHLSQNKRKKVLRGFTLVETMMTSVVAIIIIAFLTSFFLNAIIGKQMFLLRQELTYNMDYILRTVQYQLKQSTNVDTVNSLLAVHPSDLRVSTSDTDPVIIASSGSNLTMTMGTEGPYNMISSRNTLTQWIVDYQTPNNSPGIITGTITLQSVIDPTISLTEDFSLTLRAHTP